MDLPATLVAPDGEERVIIDPRTYNQLRYGYGWSPLVAPVVEPAIVHEPAPEPAPQEPQLDVSGVSVEK